MICARTSRAVSPVECCTIIVATTAAADIATCQACEAGQMLIASAEFRRKQKPAEVVPPVEAPPVLEPIEKPAPPAYLRDALAYLLPRHKRDKKFGLRFLAMVSSQFGFVGSALDFQAACLSAGLTLIEKPLLAVVHDDAMRKLARNK